MDPQLIISAVTSNTQNGNITKSRANIYTIGPHGYRCSEYHAGLNEVLEMTKSVNLNTVSLCSTDFSFTINTNVANKYRYIGILSNMLDFPSKGIFYANQVRADAHFHDKNLRKLEKKG